MNKTDLIKLNRGVWFCFPLQGGPGLPGRAGFPVSLPLLHNCVFLHNHMHNIKNLICNYMNVGHQMISLYGILLEQYCNAVLVRDNFEINTCLER